MIINYLGGGSFKLQSGQNSILIDPESNRFKADVVLRTLSPTHVRPEVGEGSEYEISFAGEYEFKGIEVAGIAIKEESVEKFLKTAYLIDWEGVKVAVMGHISKPPSPEVVGRLDEPDVLILPVGGDRFLSPEAAAKLARQLEPTFVIPSFYKSPADFLKAMGQKTQAEEKLVFKRKDLGEAKNRVVVLKT